MSAEIKRIFGVPFPTCASKEFVDILDAYNVKDLDTAALYPGSEQGIGDEGLPKKFTIHTKAEYKPGGGSYEVILKSAAASLEKLRVESVETYFLHAPDPETPFPQTLDAIQKLYLEGRFKHFGISNFLPAQVQEVYDYCSSKGYVLPTVFQGSYNPVVRHAEEELFPLLRKLKISFYAYGALAGGFLTKSAEFFSEANSETRVGTRWDRSIDYGQLFNGLYNKPSFIAALKDWDAISKESGISKADLSFRWVAYNSYLSKEFGDGIILGALKSEQLGRTLEGLQNGPLEDSVVEKINAVWESVKHEAPFDNFRPHKL